MDTSTDFCVDDWVAFEVFWDRNRVVGKVIHSTDVDRPPETVLVRLIYDFHTSPSWTLFYIHKSNLVKITPTDEELEQWILSEIML